MSLIRSNSLRNKVKSDERFAWLFGLTEDPSTHPKTVEEFEEACRFALSNWHVLQVTAPLLMRWAHQRYKSNPFWNLIKERTLSLSLLGRLRIMLLKRIVETLDYEEIPYVLLKGTALGFTTYSSPTARVGQDIDIGVPAAYLRDFEKAVLTLGFEPGQWLDAEGVFCSPDFVERAAVEAAHYELGYLVRRQVLRNLSKHNDSILRRNIASEPKQTWHVTSDGRLACYLILDVHHGLTQSISIDNVLESSKRISYQGSEFRVVSNAWALFHLISKIYLEGVNNYITGVYQYADLTRLVRLLTRADIEEVKTLLNRYVLRAGGFYVLRRIESVFNEKLPLSLRTFIDSASLPPLNSNPVEENDFGDMWQKLWGYR